MANGIPQREHACRREACSGCSALDTLAPFGFSWLSLASATMVIQRHDPMGLSSLPWILSSRVPQKTLAAFAAAIAAWT